MAWAMPHVELGQTVHYFAHEGAAPTMAFVTKVGKDALDLWALAPGYGGVDKPSVRHTDDPRLEGHSEWKKYGTWLPAAKDPMVSILSEKNAVLERRVATLEKTVADLSEELGVGTGPKKGNKG